MCYFIFCLVQKIWNVYVMKYDNAEINSNFQLFFQYF